MKILLQVLVGIGLVIFFLGMGAGDSENLLFPLGMIVIGGGLMLGSGLLLERYFPESLK